MLLVVRNTLSKFKGFLPPLKEVLSENGVGSYSRYSGMIIVLATIAWVTYLVIHNHAMPDMAGPTAFVAGGQTQYAASQVKHVVAAVKGAQVGQATPEVVISPGGNNDAAQS